MRILFVFDGLQIGGIERVGIEYIKLLLQRKFEVEVINLVPQRCAMRNMIPEEVKVSDVYFPRWMSPQRYSVFNRFGFVGHTLYFLAGCFWGLVSGCYIGLIKRKMGIKADVIIAFSGHYNDLFFVSRCNDLSKKIAWIHGSERSYHELACGFAELHSKIKNLVCLSEQGDEECSDFNKQNGINKIKIYNPNNCGDKIPNAGKIEYLKNQFKDFALMVGRLDKDKDQETLIKAIFILEQKYHIKKNLVLVGDGTERNRLERIVEKYKLEDRVFFEGSQGDVQNYYLAASVYVHSSPAEGLPTVLLEAMYYELPIVATNSEPGVKEILQDNAGLVSPVGDAERIADNLFKVYMDEKLKEKLIKNGIKRRQFFSPSIVIDRFVKFMESIDE